MQSTIKFTERCDLKEDAENMIRISWAEFITIVEEALRSCGAVDVRFVDKEEKVEFKLNESVREGEVAEIFIKNMYEKKKFLDPKECLTSIKAQLKHLADVYTESEDFVGDRPPKVLYPTVQTHEVILSCNESHRDRSGEFRDQLVFKEFSSGSGELFLALVLGVKRDNELLDTWVSSQLIQSWNITEDQAFELAIRNLDKITPKKLKCKIFNKASEFSKASDYGKISSIPILCDMSDVRSTGGHGSLTVLFSDQRALPRLLLPRVINRLAEILKCDATSLILVPFEDGVFFAACGEDCQSMTKMSRHHFSPDAQGDSPHTKYKVTHSPFRVRNRPDLS